MTENTERDEAVQMVGEVFAERLDGLVVSALSRPVRDDTAPADEIPVTEEYPGPDHWMNDSGVPVTGGLDLEAFRVSAVELASRLSPPTREALAANLDTREVMAFAVFRALHHGESWDDWETCKRWPGHAHNWEIADRLIAFAPFDGLSSPETEGEKN